MTVCLLVNDDLQSTFIRYHALEVGCEVEPFIPGELTKNTVLNPTHTYKKNQQVASLPAVI